MSPLLVAQAYCSRVTVDHNLFVVVVVVIKTC